MTQEGHGIELRQTADRSQPAQPAAAAHQWAFLPADDVLRRLEVDGLSGLASTDIDRRIGIYGENALAEVSGTSWYGILARQFTSVLILILIIAAIVSLLVGATVDSMAILAIVLLNGILGFVQEYRAEQAIDSLKRMLAPRARVRRDGIICDIDARQIVPGDVAIVETGDRIPADVRLLDSLELAVDESALTGESVPVRKSPARAEPESVLSEQAGMVWMGTTVTGGRAEGVVVATGEHTAFGRIAFLTGSVGKERTPLQQRLSRLGRQLGIFALSVSTLIAITGWLSGRELLEMFFTGVSLAVAVVPEGLPAVVTVTLALGIRKMVGRNVLLRRLSAAEALGESTVICTDKTGTLTRSEMTVRRVWMPMTEIEISGAGYETTGSFTVNGIAIDPQSREDLMRLLESGLLCSHAELRSDNGAVSAIGDPTELAIVAAAYKAGLDKAGTRLVKEQPFSSSTKYMAIAFESDDDVVIHSKGAPEVIIERCTHVQVGDAVKPMNDDLRDAARSAYQNMAATGLRTVAVARKAVFDIADLEDSGWDSGMTLLGITGMVDPPRPEARDAIRLARKAGIRVIMITGDAQETASYVAGKLDLGVDRVIEGRELSHMTDKQLSDELRSNVLFARTLPEHKLRIVRLLQEDGETVGMTGDGINDAPALRKADVGIAMGIRGTDVAHNSSDVVLTDDNFASIVSGIEEGRRQYDSLKKFVRYLLTSNTGEVFAIFGSIILGGPLIFLPVQILWMNLVTDGITALALGVEPLNPETMKRPPHRAGSPIIGLKWWLAIVVIGIYLAIASVWLFAINYEGDVDKARTIAFTALVIMEKVNVFNFRSFTQPIIRFGFFSNPWLIGAVLISLVLQLAAVYTPFLNAILHTVPLEAADWLIIAALSAPVFLVPELIKWVRQIVVRET